MYGNKKSAMKSLAKLGRKGDNKIREVGGQPSHVNALEAYLIDNFGDSGRQATQRMGSGTINPNTGLREYAIGDWMKQPWRQKAKDVTDFYAGGVKTLATSGMYLPWKALGATIGGADDEYALAIGEKDWEGLGPFQQMQEGWQKVLPTYHIDPETGRKYKSSRFWESPEEARGETGLPEAQTYGMEFQKELGEAETQLRPIPGKIETAVGGIKEKYDIGVTAAEELYGKWSDEGEFLGGGMLEDVMSATGEWEQDEVTGEWTYIEGTGGSDVTTLEQIKERAIEDALGTAEESQMALGGEYGMAKSEAAKALGATGMARHGGVTSQFEDVESAIYGGIAQTGTQYGETAEIVEEDFAAKMQELGTRYGQTYETASEKYDIEMDKLATAARTTDVDAAVNPYETQIANILTGFASGTDVGFEDYLKRVSGRVSEPYEKALEAVDKYRDFDPLTEDTKV